MFPQEGLISFPGTDELLVEALRRGAKVLGGAPRYDTDEAGQIRRIFELAREFDVDLDIHLDVGNTPDAMNIHLVRELTDQYRRGGRVVVGHMAKLSLLPPDQLRRWRGRWRTQGIAVTVLPATDLFLMGRDRDHSVVRGVADANFLCEHGVNCSLSSNNILNPATPYGDCSLIRMANLYANVLQVDRAGAVARMLRHADLPLGAADEPDGLRFCGRQSGRRRDHRRADARAGGRRDRAPARGLQERPAHGRVAAAGIDPAELSAVRASRREGTRELLACIKLATQRAEEGANVDLRESCSSRWSRSSMSISWCWRCFSGPRRARAPRSA